MINRTDSEFITQLRATLDVLPDPTFAINTAGEVIVWNRVLSELSNIPASEMLGKGNYEYSLPFYGKRRPILLDLVLKYEANDKIASSYPYIKHDDVGNLMTEVFTPNFAREGGIFISAKARRLVNAKGEVNRFKLSFCR